MNKRSGNRITGRLVRTRLLHLLGVVGVLGWTMAIRADDPDLDSSSKLVGQAVTIAHSEKATEEIQSQGPASAVVQITDRLRFEPNRVEVEVGDDVEWNNISVLVHTVTGDPSLAQIDGSAVLPSGAVPFNSNNLESGATFRHRFDVPGVYQYFCIPHEAAKMTGTIVVRER